MPRPGVPNNAGGANGYEPFVSEPAYGQIKQDKELAQGAPLVTGQVAVGALNAPKRAQRRTQRSAAPATPPESGAAEPIPPPTPPPPPSDADVWQQIATSPGAENYPILAYYANQARLGQ